MVDYHDQFLEIPDGAPIPKQRKKSNFSIKDICNAHKSLITTWCRIKKSPSSISSDKPQSSSEAKLEAVNIVRPEPEKFRYHTIDETSMNGIHSFRYNTDSSNSSSPRGFYKHRSMDSCFPHVLSPLSRSGSRKIPSSTPRSIGRKSPDSIINNGFPSSLSRSASRVSASTPIMFSNSTGLVKPPDIQKNLECTLEQLCYGCMKKIKVTRDVLTTAGKIIQEEEILTMRVKPGWKKGTKITFEGMGNERPGTYPADITFVLAEKRHPLFRREGDDLEIAVEIPLVQALTGCEISIPLLGGEQMHLVIDDIIYPGYEKIITGQGMPNTKDKDKRGNLKVVFLVSFPTELTNEQRLNILSILEDSC